MKYSAIRQFTTFPLFFAALLFLLSSPPALVPGRVSAQMPAQMPTQLSKPEITREQIQSFFITSPGNAIRSTGWSAFFQGKQVSWSGTVYKIKKRKTSSRVEFMIRVLPDSLLYDTIVVLEGETLYDPAIRENMVIAFDGKIINGVDVVGVKQVYVLANGPHAIRYIGPASRKP